MIIQEPSKKTNKKSIYLSIKESNSLKKIIGLFTITGIIIAFFQNVEWVKNIIPYSITSQFQKSFFSSDSTFNILILPFNNLIDNDKKKIDRLVYERFKKKDSINIDVHFEYDYPIEDLDDIKNKFNDENVDLIIYGEYGELDKTEINIKWYLRKPIETIISKNCETGLFQLKNIADINSDEIYIITDYIINYSLGTMYMQKGEYSKSLSYYEDSLQNLKRFQSISNKDKFLFYYTGINYFLKNDINKFFIYQDIATSIDDNFKQALRIKALIYLYIDSSEKALNLCNKAIKIDSNYFDAWCTKGIIHSEIGNYTTALKSFNHAMKSEPHNYILLYNVGLVYQRKHELMRALEYYNQSISFESNFFNSWYNKGDILSRQEKYYSSIRSYKRALEINTEDKNSFLGIGVNQLELGFTNFAINSFKKVLEIDSNDIEASVNLGTSYFIKNKLDLALKYYKLAITVDSTSSYSLYKLGYIYYVKEKYDSALFYFNHVLLIDSNNSDAWTNKAHLELLFGDTASFQNSIKKAK